MNTAFEPKALPVLKWVGGKRKLVPTLAPQIKTYIEETKGHYIEPFVGGGAMMLGLGLPKMVINDILPDLARTYLAVRDSPAEVKNLLCDMRDWGTEESHYYAVRESEPDTDVDAAARMIYLNHLCFNGICRHNKSGKFNVPYGKQPGRITDDLLERIDTASEALQGVEILNGDFEPIIKAAEKGDLLYVDPPYDGTFVDYAQESFVGMSQHRLGSELAEAHKRGVAFIAHNSDTELIRSWFSYATIIKIGESRSVNSDGKGRGKAPCLLITNRPGLLAGHLTT